MRIEKPIIIVGTGRSGTTIFYKILSQHKDVVWLSSLLSKFPEKLWIERYFHTLVKLPILGYLLKKRYPPTETYTFWNHYYKGFATPIRDLTSDDVTLKVKADIRSAFEKILGGGKKRLVIKITGWPRIGFLKEIFPDAKFINVIRDGRAVAYSLMNVPWWWGWRGPQNWRFGELPQNLKLKWEKYDRSFIALAAIEWMILMDAFEKAKQYIQKDNYLEIKYEDLCANPIEVFKKILEFAELKYPKDFIKTIRQFDLKNKNYKWQIELTEYQKEILNDILKDYLVKYRYCVS